MATFETWEEVGTGLFRIRYEALDQNIGVALGDEALLVIDTRATHDQAGQLIRDLKRLSSLPVRWIVNTHWHWDHVFGNAMFPAATIVGHDNTRAHMVERGDLDRVKLMGADWISDELREGFGRVRIAPPTVSFGHELSIHLEPFSVRLRHRGRGHTDSDITIHIDDVCFAGDLVEEGAPPSFGDGFPEAWVECLARLIPDLPETIVPGHGDVVGVDFVKSQLEELQACAVWASAVDRGDTDMPQAPYPNDVMATVLDRWRREQAG